MSITQDNGIENREYRNIGIPSFFCDPYSSWQKGGVENANKMIRRYVPKGIDPVLLVTKNPSTVDPKRIFERSAKYFERISI